jgi:hypothetical protein
MEVAHTIWQQLLCYLAQFEYYFQWLFKLDAIVLRSISASVQGITQAVMAPEIG